MSIVVLYLLLLKATVTSFSGLSSLPVLRQDLVVRHAPDLPAGDLVRPQRDGFVLHAIARGEVRRQLAGEGRKRFGLLSSGHKRPGDIARCVAHFASRRLPRRC